MFLFSPNAVALNNESLNDVIPAIAYTDNDTGIRKYTNYVVFLG